LRQYPKNFPVIVHDFFRQGHLPPKVRVVRSDAQATVWRFDQIKDIALLNAQPLLNH
jgi:hypothetical protein